MAQRTYVRIALRMAVVVIHILQLIKINKGHAEAGLPASQLPDSLKIGCAVPQPGKSVAPCAVAQFLDFSEFRDVNPVMQANRLPSNQFMKLPVLRYVLPLSLQKSSHTTCFPVFRASSKKQTVQRLS